MPVDPSVRLDQGVLAGGGGDVPAGLAPVDERGPAPPAVRVRVDVGLAADQEPGRLQAVVDLAVRLARAPSGQPAHGVGEGAVGSDRVERGQPVLPADLAVDLAEGRGQVDQPGPLLGGDEVGRHHPPGVGAGRYRDVVEGSAVRQADEVGPRQPGRDDRPVAEDVADQRLGHDLAVDHGVGEVGSHRNPGVGQEGPRGRRPDHERRGVAHHRGVGIDEGEQHVGRLVLFVGVHPGLAQLVAGQRRPTARAVRHHLEVLVEEALIEEALQVPPDRLDIGGVEGPVGGVEVDPVADPLGQVLPVVDVVEDGLAAQAGEFGDPDISFDLALAGDAEALLHLDLDRQAVGVPTGAAGHVVPAHGAVPAEEVLVGPGPDVVQAGLAVGRGGALVEDPRLGSLALGHRPLEDAVLAPAGQLRLLEDGEIGVGWDGTEHGSPVVVGSRNDTGRARAPGAGSGQLVVP